MELKCIRKTDVNDNSFTVGNTYDVIEEHHDSYTVVGDDGISWEVDKYTMEFAGDASLGIFEIVEDSVATAEESCSPYCDKPMTPQSTMESLKIATLRSIQEQCSKANLSISIDPEGFNIFDCDTDMQTMVSSVADAIEILETKIEYKDSMGKWGWL